MLLDVLSNLSPSRAASDVLPPPFSIAEKSSLVSTDRGVNVCSAKVTEGRGEDCEAGEAMVVEVA